MNDTGPSLDFEKLLNDPKLQLVVDPLVVLSNQHQLGIEMLKAKSTLVFNMNTNRRTEFIELLNRLTEQRNTWRLGVLSNMKQTPWLPKRLESRFASNQPPYIDPRYVSSNDIVQQFFETLQTDIDVLAEAIDYGKTVQATDQKENAMPRVSFTKQDGLTIDGIKIPLGAKEQTVCGIIFANKKLLNKNWLFDELLEERAEQLRSNDLGTVRKLQSIKTRLNKKIAERTPNNIKDVFIGHGSIQLNPKYC